MFLARLINWRLSFAGDTKGGKKSNYEITLAEDLSRN